MVNPGDLAGNAEEEEEEEEKDPGSATLKVDALQLRHQVLVVGMAGQHQCTATR